MSQLTEKNISELLAYHFFIPSYQRGFRWSGQQVMDLLNDIWHFTIKPDKKDNDWYCLQPIVVKDRGQLYEVIDGQQRLTTLKILLTYLSKADEKRKYQKGDLVINYETRPESEEFLEDPKEDHSNIDHYYMWKAYQVISDWFSDKEQEEQDRFLSTLLAEAKEGHPVKVIWYEISESKDEIAIFTRLNMGKIPLTNAELVRSLFLNSSNFQGSDLEALRLRQLEIASEWDRIENKLRDPERWAFIDHPKNEPHNRIEFILDLIKAMDGTEKADDPYTTFRFFSDKFKSHTKREMEKHWKSIKSTFRMIDEWYLDRESYHKVGFLIDIGIGITTLLQKARKRSKKQFKEWMNDRIASEIACDDLESLSYGKDSSLIRKLLLFHNVQTLLSSDNESHNFSFYRYKKDKWDLEHIHATADKVVVPENEQIAWLADNFVKGKQQNDRDIDEKIEKMIADNTSIPEEDFQMIISYVLGDEDDSISNLCLLDRNTNRSYKNDSFKVKRKKIIKKEKAGTFIPICTRNVFLKYYSQEMKDVALWNPDDRQDYLADLKRSINTIKK